MITGVFAIGAVPAQDETVSGPPSSLYFHWIGVVDNGEGDGAHGPHGNLHIDVWDARGRKIVDNNVLVGPSNGDFLDGDQGSYFFSVGTISKYNRAIRIRIWESDPGPFRSHDVLFDQWISGPGIYGSGYAAGSVAVRNALRRGATKWVNEIGYYLHHGIPKVFLEVIESKGETEKERKAESKKGLD